MSLDFDKPPVLTDGPPSLAQLADQYDRPDVLVIGEYHYGPHKNYLLGQLPNLQKMGYDKLFLEFPVTMNPHFVELPITRSFPFNSADGMLKSFVLGANDMGMKMRAVDMPLDQLDQIQQQMKSFSINSTIDKRNDRLVEMMKGHELKKEDLLRLASQADVALLFGPKTLDCLSDEWKLSLNDRQVLLQIMDSCSDELIGINKKKKATLGRYNFSRNKFMCERVKNNIKSEKAIMLVGLAHTSVAVSEVKDDVTIQAGLDGAGLSTLTIGLHNSADLGLVGSNAWNWVDKGEFRPDVAKAFDYTPIQLAACINRIADKNIVQDNYEDDNLDEPDIHIHLPQLTVNYI